MKGYIVRLFSFVAIIAMATAMLPANASGVTLNYTTPANGEIDAADAGGFAEIIFGWTASGNYSSGDTITVVISPTPLAPTLVKNCTSATNSVAGGSGSFGSFTDAGATWTFSGNAANLNAEMCLSIPVTTAGPGTITPRNISVAILSSGAHVDYGALLYYLGGGNDVNVTATVTATLSFEIVDDSNVNSPKNTCALGSLSMTAVNECAYRLKINTNSAGGFTSTIDADQQLSTPSSDTIQDVSGTVVAGTESYGIAVTGASIGGRDSGTGAFGNPVVEQGVFSSDDSAVPTAPTAFISYNDGFWSSSTHSTTLVTHKASVSPATPAGNYSQTVTYAVTGSF